MSGEGYNGWANYETWLVNMWAGDDETFRDLGTKDATGESLKDYILDCWDDLTPNVATSGLFADLMNAALRSVDWRELAETYAEEVE